MTRDPDTEVRSSAAYALQKSAVADAAVKEAATRLLEDAQFAVRNSALYLTRQLFTESLTPTVLSRFLDDSEHEVRLHALRIFKDLFPQLLPPVDRVKTFLRDPDIELRRTMIEWVSDAGKAAPDFTPELSEALLTPALELAAAKAIWTTARRADLVVPVILRNLCEREGSCPETACDLITHVGPAARRALPLLIDLLKSKEWDVHWAVVDAIGAIGPDAARAIPHLVKALDHESGIVASGAAHALAEIGPESFAPVFKVLKKGGVRAKEFAADCLGRMGEAAEEALPKLIELHDDESSPVELRCWACLAIVEISPIVEALKKIVGLLDEGLASDMRIRAAGVLGKLGPAACPAIPDLEKAAGDEMKDVSSAALEALRKIRGS